MPGTSWCGFLDKKPLPALKSYLPEKIGKLIEQEKRGGCAHARGADATTGRPEDVGAARRQHAPERHALAVLHRDALHLAAPGRGVGDSRRTGSTRRPS